MDRLRSALAWYRQPSGPDSLAMATVKGYSTLIGAILLHGVIGATSMGNVITYMTSYMRFYVNKSANYGENIWISSIGVTAFALFTIIGGYLNRLLPYRAVISIGLLIISLATYLNTISLNHSFGMLLLTFAFMQSAGAGLIYSNVIVVSVKWFPSYCGLITGLIVALDSVASFVAMQLQTMYFNPNNVAPDPSGYFIDPVLLAKVPIYFKIVAIIFLVSGMIGVLMSFMPSPETIQLLISASGGAATTSNAPASTSGGPAHENERTNYGAMEDGDECELTSSGGSGNTSDGFLSTSWAENLLEKDVLGILREEVENENMQQQQQEIARQQQEGGTSSQTQPPPRKNYFGVRRALRTKMALVLFITFGLSTESNYFITAMGKPFGQTFIFDDHYLAAVISLSNLANCFGSFLCGKMLDRYKFKVSVECIFGKHAN